MSRFFSGFTISAKIYEKNQEMEKILKRLGFQPKARIKGDYVSDRTSLVFEANSSATKKYFGCENENRRK